MLQPLLVRQLSASEKESLERCRGSKNKAESWRAEAILLSAEGKTAAEISEALGYHPSNIKKWIRKFNEEGIEGIVAKKRGPQGGPRPKFTKRETDEILKLYETPPRIVGYSFKEWTPQKLATAAVDRGIVDSISHVTVRQMIKGKKASIKRESDCTSASKKSSANEPSNIDNFRLGKEALSISSYEEAVKHLYAALDEESDSPDHEAMIRSLLSQALEELSRFDEAYNIIKKYEKPQTLQLLSPLKRARIKLRIGWAQSHLRNYPDAVASLNEAKILLLELQDELGVSEAQCALGRTYIEINEFRIARDHLLAAVSSQKTTRNRELLARIYDKLGNVDFNEGAFSNSKKNYLKALELAEGSSNTDLLGMILANLGAVTYIPGGVVEGYRGQREESAEYIKQAISYFEKGGRKDILALAHNNLGDNLRYSGLWDEAIESLNKAIDIARFFTRPDYEATARITLAEILCAKGEYLNAENHLKKSIELIEEGGDKWLESNALRVLAIAYMGTGQTEAAVKSLRESLQLFTSIGDLYGVMFAQVGLAECHLLQGGYEQAREYLELAHVRLKEEKSLYVSGMIQRLFGHLEMASSRLAEAKQHIAQSISIFTTIEIPYELAKSHYVMGLLLKKANDLKGAETSLLLARQMFERLGAEPSVELTLKSLDSMVEIEERESKSARFTPPTEVLLMQRLIDASASRELLLQELAAIVYENFPVSDVMICRLEKIGRLEPLAVQGLNRIEASQLCATIEPSATETVRKGKEGYMVGLGDDDDNAIILHFRAISPFDTGRLQPLLKQAELGLEICSLRAVHGTAAANIDHPIQTIIPGFIVCSDLMFDVIEKIQKIRTNDVTVLITGESGTGKELVARAIHAESARARAIFLPFNCTATPKEIIDSQLFGHRRGAFTGATANYPGIIKAADGGTLFLDEIGDLSLEVQPKLMRFLQESEIQPLGETRPLRVDVRVLAATNTDLEHAVEDGRFREDLFHRLNIIRIHVPPLRERCEEVPILAGHFLEHFSSRSGKDGIMLTQEALDLLTEYDWPGNVRQLRNEIERVIAYASEGSRISVTDLSPEIAHPRNQVASARLVGINNHGYGSNGSGMGSAGSNGRKFKRAVSEKNRIKLKEATAELERQLIEESLIRNKNNLSRTALDLGLSRRGLRLKIENLGIQKEELV